MSLRPRPVWWVSIPSRSLGAFREAHPSLVGLQRLRLFSSLLLPVPPPLTLSLGSLLHRDFGPSVLGRMRHDNHSARDLLFTDPQELLMGFLIGKKIGISFCSGTVPIYFFNKTFLKKHIYLQNNILQQC